MVGHELAAVTQRPATGQHLPSYSLTANVLAVISAAQMQAVRAYLVQRLLSLVDLIEYHQVKGLSD
ncbi:hypothetical protein BEN47_09935 [Hymenobacter lapidarius]|uniref:Uncharacterized protein n=1 Tax=Hymenobacter lapidarius TaxID=1908237 RepID=A0A1G1TB15_9BACT|nr:hypothetical protein BEN47_09935 [Hymenobacter lapidarius]